MFNHLFTPRNFCLAVRKGAACSGMGTWEGHISPGVAFYSFGIVFCFQYSREYLLQGKKTGAPKAKKDATRLGKVFIKIKHFPLDSFLKILYGFGAAMAELFYPPGTNKLYMVDQNGHWAHLNEWQHFTMYMSFAVSGVIDIISQKVMKKRAVALEKAAVAAAFYITSILLFYHKHGKGELESEAHELLLYAALMMCAVLTAEIWCPFDPRLMWAHTVLVMQLGSWLFNLAFILFPRVGHRWDPDDMWNQMVLPIFFCWHIFLNLTVLFLIFLSQYLYLKFCKGNTYSSIESNELQSCCPSRDSDNSDVEAPASGKLPNRYTSKKSDETSPFLSETETTYA